VTAVVVDTSLVVYALTTGASDGLLRRRLSEPRMLTAPHLVDFEFAHAIRGLTLSGRLSVARATQARSDFADLHIERFPGAVLAARIWQLRANFTAYDAAYVALAELLDCPLLTGDAKLKGPHRAQVQVYPI
jgi:predicted nucleic acid-binding protein